MTRLLTLTMFAVALLLAQPAQAQQQDAQKDSMEMKQDSTMTKEMMQKMRNNPEMHKKMMRMMMQNMKSDSTMSGMCMKGMDMDMKNMPEDKNKGNEDTKMKKSEG